MFSRRRFVTEAASALTLAGLVSPLALSAAAGRNALSTGRRQSLLAALLKEDHRYDPLAKLLVSSTTTHPEYRPARGPGIVHPTRLSLDYAAASLDAGEPWRVERAGEIIRTVLGLQDHNRSSNTHGLWPRSLEEPITPSSPPDWHHADLCAMPLLMAWTLHRDQLVKGLANAVREAIVLAAESIQRRTDGPADTGIAVLGAAVTLIAAQEFKLPELRAQAKTGLRDLHGRIMRQGSFAEYNSPPDMVFVLQELSRMLWLVRDGRDKALVSDLHDLAWKHVATHFHAPTRQWAGPHSRSDETDLRKKPATLAFIQAACDGMAELGSPDPLPLGLEAYRMPLQCPRKSARLFGKLEAARQVVEAFVQADATKDGERVPVIGTTWLHPYFTLGTVNRGDLGSQRRPFLAYWGMPSAPRFLRVRLLKDDADFSSGLFFSVQHEGFALAVVTLCTDHGNSHPVLDPIKDGTVKAASLKLRFEFGGELGACTVQAVDGGNRALIIQDRAVRFVLRPVAGNFGDASVRWELPELKLANHVDVVLYRGEAREHRLSELTAAFASFTFEQWPYDLGTLPAAGMESRLMEGKLRARWIAGGKALDLEAPIKPAPYASMNDAFRSSVV